MMLRMIFLFFIFIYLLEVPNKKQNINQVISVI